VEDLRFRVDRCTQQIVRAAGRRVSFDEYRWLLGPVGGFREIGDDWLTLEAGRHGGFVDKGGLLNAMSDLDGPGFSAADLAGPVVDFYERTSDWRLEVWSQWCPAAWPFGWLISSIFAKRLQQLNLPLRPLDTAYGMDSRVMAVRNQQGSQVGAAWLRTLRTTGQAIYSGWYSSELLPGADRPSVRVVFPLPNGSVTVLLRPEVRSDGALILSSPLGRFGAEGAYLVVARPDRKSGWALRVPLAERFVVFVDNEGVLRTDHELNLSHVPVLRLHYRLESAA
jgi:hypothetical protein